MCFMLIYYFDLSFIKNFIHLNLQSGVAVYKASARQMGPENLKARYTTNTTVALAQTFGRCVDGAPLW